MKYNKKEVEARRKNQLFLMEVIESNNHTIERQKKENREKKYTKEVYLGKDEILKVFFEGHEYNIQYDEETNENIKLERII